MLNSNHTELIVALFKVIDGLRTRNTKISKSTKFPYFIISRPLRAKEEITKKTKKFEHNVIQFANFYNKIVNFFRNNRFSLWIKEAFYSFWGTPYPEFLFNKERNDYVSFIQNGVTERGEPFTEFRSTPSVDYAIDFSKYWIWEKKRFLKDVSKATEKYNSQCDNENKPEEKILGEYRFRKILTYEKIY